MNRHKKPRPARVKACCVLSLRVDGDFTLIETNHGLGIGQGITVRFGGVSLDPLGIEGYILLSFLEEHLCDDETGGIGSDVHNMDYNDWPKAKHKHKIN